MNEADQKSYLLESVHPDVVHHLLVKGVEASSPGEMMALVKETVLGRFWQKRLLDKWQTMAMLDSESVFQFQQTVHMIMFALGHRLECIDKHRVWGSQVKSRPFMRRSWSSSGLKMVRPTIWPTDKR